MSLTGLLARPATILRAVTAEDRYGNTVLDWSDPASTPVRGWLAQSSGTEDRDRRDAAVSTWVFVMPAGTDVTALDRVHIDPVTYELAGPPNEAWTPRGPHHIEATLRLVEG